MTRKQVFFKLLEVGDTGTSTCLLIFENLLRFNQPILINWVPGSMGWAYVQQRTKKINKHEYLILNLGWHLLCSSHKRHLTYNLNLIKQEMKMPKITNFFVPKIYYSLFSCCAYSPFICSFIRCQTLNILFYVTFIQKGFCVMTFVRYQKKDREKVQALEPTAPIKRNRTK